MTARQEPARRIVALLVVLILATAVPCMPAQATPAEDIFAYAGPDRQQKLEEGAKKEGKILWYTTMILDQRARPLAAAFRKKYPFIDVAVVQLDTGPLVQRSLGEFNARKLDLDMVEGNLPVALALKGVGALAKFRSPQMAGLPPAVIDPEGYFVADREVPLGFGYNTTLLPQAQAPKSRDDLLSPALKGKLSTNDSVQGAIYFGALMREKGEDFVRKLAAQQVTVYSNMSSNAVTDLVASGVAVATFPTSVGQVTSIRDKGAPIAWSPLGKAFTVTGVLGALANSPHPNAAALFMDFLIGDEGQQTMVGTGEGGTRIGLANRYGGYVFEKQYLDTSLPQAEYLGTIKNWTDMFNSIMVKR
jgi:iron(III) transport system substrate-binding protein